MTYLFNVVVEQDSTGYFIAEVPNLPGCHTQAKSLNKLMERIDEAIELCEISLLQDIKEALCYSDADRVVDNNAVRRKFGIAE